MPAFSPAALKELHRCLRPGGKAIIMVPVIEGWKRTYENEAANSNRDRNLHVGQSDHIRYYGSDVRARIRKAGFQLNEYISAGEECVRYGLTPGEVVFIAQRPSAHSNSRKLPRA